MFEKDAIRAKNMPNNSDLTKLTADELLSAVQPRSDIRITARMEFKRRLERLEKCEETLGKSQRIEKEGIQAIASAAAAEKRLEKCEAVAEYAQHYASCEFLESGIGHPMPCTCGLDAARAAVEE